MRNIICPLCGSNRYTIIKKYQHFGFSEYNCSLVCCGSCSHFFTEIPDEIDMEKLYGAGQYEVVDNRGTIFSKALSVDDSAIIKKLSQLYPSHGKLLDFGCGKGSFIHLAAQQGWQVKGIETAKMRADFAKKIYGLNISTDEYTKGSIDGAPYDVITLFHVIEHLSEPKVLLKNLIGDNLNKKGLVITEVPLFNSLQSKIAGSHWIHLDPPFHLSHFSESALTNLLDDVGLKVVMTQRFSIHVGLLGMVQSIMSMFGYRKMLITELKLRKTKRLIAAVFLALPAAILLEAMAVLFKRGGIIRVYCKRENDL